MTGFLRAVCSLLSVACLVGAAAAPASAATSHASTVADAFGALTVFMLKVAAGNDGQPQKPQAKHQFKAAFAAMVAESYAGADPEAQQAVAILPDLDVRLHQAWPLLPQAQRNTLRDQWPRLSNR